MIIIEMMVDGDCSVTLPAGITAQEARQNSMGERLKTRFEA